LVELNSRCFPIGCGEGIGRIDTWGFPIGWAIFPNTVMAEWPNGDKGKR
jgi:hypothetical protein